jgi:hypothetical protein
MKAAVLLGLAERGRIRGKIGIEGLIFQSLNPFEFFSSFQKLSLCFSKIIPIDVSE